MKAILDVFWQKKPVTIDVDGHRKKCGRCPYLIPGGKPEAKCRQFGTITRIHRRVGQYHRHEECLNREVKA